MGRDDRILSQGLARSACPRDAARRRGVRVAPRHLRGRGVPPTPAVRRLEHRPGDPRPGRSGAARSRAARPTERPNAITCSSTFASSVLGWIGAGGKATEKRIPPMVFAWPHGARSRRSSKVSSTATAASRTPVPRSGRPPTGWSRICSCCSPVSAVARHVAGATAAMRRSARCTAPTQRAQAADRACRCPTSSSSRARARRAGSADREPRSRVQATRRISTTSSADAAGRGPVATLRRLRDAYASRAAASRARPPRSAGRRRSACGTWSSRCATPGSSRRSSTSRCGRAGGTSRTSSPARGGVFVSNTAGFVDAGWDGHLTLELSNVATLPIALYPGMKIGQISFLRMTTAGRAPVRQRRDGLEVPGSARAHAVALLPQLPRFRWRATPEPAALRVGGHRPAHGRVPRRRVGRARARRPPPLRAAHARGRAGGPELDARSCASARATAPRSPASTSTTVAAFTDADVDRLRRWTRRSSGTGARSRSTVNNARARARGAGGVRQPSTRTCGGSSTARRSSATSDELGELPSIDRRVRPR